MIVADATTRLSPECGGEGDGPRRGPPHRRSAPFTLADVAGPHAPRLPALRQCTPVLHLAIQHDVAEDWVEPAARKTECAEVSRVGVVPRRRHQHPAPAVGSETLADVGGRRGRPTVNVSDSSRNSRYRRSRWRLTAKTLSRRASACCRGGGRPGTRRRTGRRSGDRLGRRGGRRAGSRRAMAPAPQTWDSTCEIYRRLPRPANAATPRRSVRAGPGAADGGNIRRGGGCSRLR